MHKKDIFEDLKVYLSKLMFLLLITEYTTENKIRGAKA
jgi:hypothetical protein